MPLVFNGVTISENVANALSFNGVNITDVFFNGVQVWNQLLFSNVWSGDSLVNQAGQIVGLDTSGSLYRYTAYNYGGSPLSTPWSTANADGTFKTETISVVVNKFPSGTNTIGIKTSPSLFGIYLSGVSSTSCGWSVAGGFTGESRLSGGAEASYETSGGLIRFRSDTYIGPWISLT